MKNKQVASIRMQLELRIAELQQAVKDIRSGAVAASDYFLYSPGKAKERALAWREEELQQLQDDLQLVGELDEILAAHDTVAA